MHNRKFTAPRIFDGFQFLAKGQVLVTDDRGKILDIVPGAEAGDDIRVFEGILCPGFINCHAHLELSHMKGIIPENTGLVDFVISVVEQRHHPEEQILSAIEKAEDEMWRNGMVAVGDICNNLLTLSQKKKARLHYHNFIESSGYHPSIASERFERSRGLYNEYAKLPSSHSSIVPHAPYSVSDELWELIIHFPGNELLSIHNQETAAENEWSVEKKGELEIMYQRMKIDTDFYTPAGKSSLQYYLPKFLPGQQVILVHNVHSTREDVRFSRQMTNNSYYWCLCPAANKYISGVLPDVEMLVGEKCDLVLGTDSLASNIKLDMLYEISLLRKEFAFLGDETVLRWATSNGARALRMAETLGSFEQGKTPGVIHIDDEFLSANRLI